MCSSAYMLVPTHTEFLSLYHIDVQIAQLKFSHKFACIPPSVFKNPGSTPSRYTSLRQAGLIWLSLRCAGPNYIGEGQSLMLLFSNKT